MAVLNASVKVYLGLSSTVSNASPTWQDITSKVRSVQISRGRSDYTQQFPAGTCNLTLDNNDRAFDPAYASSPYAGYFTKRLQIKVEAVYSATTYSLFRGWVSGWPQSYEADGVDAVVNISAFDLIGLLGLIEAPDVLAQLQDVNWILGDQLAIPIPDAEGTGLTGVVEGLTTSDFISVDSCVPTSSSKATVLQNYTADSTTTAGVGFTATDEAGISFWMRQSAPSAGSVNLCQLRGSDFGFNTWNAYLFVSDTGLLCMATDLQPLIFLGAMVADGQNHHIALTLAGGYVYAYMDGVLLNPSGVYPTIDILPVSDAAWVYFLQNDTVERALQYVKIWQTTPYAANIYENYLLGAGNLQTTSDRLSQAIEAAGFTASDWYYANAGSFQQVYKYGASADNWLDFMQTVGDSEYGYFFCKSNGKLTLLPRYNQIGQSSTATFSDAGDMRYRDLTLDFSADRVLNDVSVTDGNGTTVQAFNPTSISEVGRRSLTLQTHLPSVTEAASLADGIATIYETPLMEAGAFQISPERNPAVYYPELLPLEIGEVVSLVRTPKVGSAINLTGVVQSINHSITPNDWTVTVYAAPGIATSLFRLDTSSLDGTDILGF